MSNMAYCRFENTYLDLQDCLENLSSTDLSESEQKYRRELILLSVDIAIDFGHEFDMEVEQV